MTYTIQILIFNFEFFYEAKNVKPNEGVHNATASKFVPEIHKVSSE